MSADLINIGLNISNCVRAKEKIESRFDHKTARKPFAASIYSKTSSILILIIEVSHHIGNFKRIHFGTNCFKNSHSLCYNKQPTLLKQEALNKKIASKQDNTLKLK